MVAIPTYLLASAAISSIGSIYHNLGVKPNIKLSSPEAATSTIHDKVVTVGDNVHAFASIQGPLVTDNFPDPAIIVVDGTSYAFATNNRGVGGSMIHVQVAQSTDNTTWTIMDGVDALPNVGAWETGGRVWAPDVVQLEDGTFVLYYTDELIISPAHHCVGAATSQTVLGPYTPLFIPLACPDVIAIGGAIDPDGFVDVDDRRYITYKVDGNSIGHGGSCQNNVVPIVPTPIMLQEVAKDGVTLIGDVMQILDRDDYDGPLIEAPALYRSDEGIYFLFFSSNCFTGPLYDTAYATATSITGPYTRAARPLLISGDGPDLLGPGGMDILKDGSTIVFHGHLSGTDYGDGKDRRQMLVRGMYSAKATFSGISVTLA